MEVTHEEAAPNGETAGEIIDAVLYQENVMIHARRIQLPLTSIVRRFKALVMKSCLSPAADSL
jgi:hypothetical protein